MLFSDDELGEDISEEVKDVEEPMMEEIEEPKGLMARRV